MKKINVVSGMLVAGLIGLGAYTLANRNTKNKADKLINNVLDKANDMTNNIME